MANSLISMIKGDSTLINNTEVLDGQVLFNTDEKTILLDDDNTRTKYCGADKSNKNLAPIENGNTATRGYSAGSYVVWKEQLYKVLTQINSGTAFVVGTNIVADTVGAELTQINSDLDGKTSGFQLITEQSTNNVETSFTIGNIAQCKSVCIAGVYNNGLLNAYTIPYDLFKTGLYISASDGTHFAQIRWVASNKVAIHTQSISVVCKLYVQW